jgi:peptide/nickel transport system substrate-binding protein
MLGRSPMLLGLILALLVGLNTAEMAAAQKLGGTLKMYTFDSPASMSIHEEATISAQGPMMGVFNNLVIFDQHVKQNSLDSIIPDLAVSWSWNQEKTFIAFELRQDVKWHDGKPFTAKDVQCTWDLLMERGAERLRSNPRKSAYRNLDSVTVEGEHRVVFQLKRPQPAFLMLLASGFSPIYPCHVSPAQMRQHPIGTGPFKFGEFKPNEYIRVTRNPDYWKPGRPYLDGIEYTIIRNVATRTLAFITGKVDMTFPNTLTVPILKDVKSQVPNAVCEIAPDGGINRNVLVNRDKPPLDNPEVRRALALTLDRKAFVDIIGQGQSDIGGVLQPLPEGLWGMPGELLRELPGYDPDVEKSRSQARQIMENLGYGSMNRVHIKVSARDIPAYRDPAVLLVDQLKQAHFEGELEFVDTTAYFPKIRRKDFTVALSLQPSGPDPDPILDLYYGCGSSSNWDNYCNAEVDKLIQQQSSEGDIARRKEIVWSIERKLGEDGARPIIFYPRMATCWHPHVKGVTIMANSTFNGNRREDVWLDR